MKQYMPSFARTTLSALGAVATLALCAPAAGAAENWKAVPGAPNVQVDLGSRAPSDVEGLVGPNLFMASVKADLPEDRKLTLAVVYDCGAKAPTVAGQRIAAQQLVDGKMTEPEIQVAKVNQPVAPGDAAGKMGWDVACTKK